MSSERNLMNVSRASSQVAESATASHSLTSKKNALLGRSGGVIRRSTRSQCWIRASSSVAMFPTYSDRSRSRSAISRLLGGASSS